MRFAVFSHVPHYIDKNKYYAYSPYVREINVWSKYVDTLVIIAPVKKKISQIDIDYSLKSTDFVYLNGLNFTSFKKAIFSIYALPLNVRRIFLEMRKADHIHVRCPGNIGLIALLVQVLFPKKKKTVKYAGNWDPKSKQPFSYRFQKWLIKSKFLTRNTKVLVYGKWKDQRENIISFFTASYSESERENIVKVFEPSFNFVFVGSLIEGKRTKLAINVIEELLSKKYRVHLDIYGDGELLEEIESIIKNKNLKKKIKLHGNHNADVIKSAYKEAHFSILPSKSEGWPKALAEAMFFGCVPIGTEVSCIPWMLGDGERGILVKPEKVNASKKIEEFLNDPKILARMSDESLKWSQKYTLERFEKEIRKLI
ncbi:glycosyltransferase involved in cell wall biosynthesis [Gramella sp. Hel_I_59]|uniref:glycosyltransferase family 4 protein n=1 Tax=Gramella sp. Hel_I_59 TaxID=1249978 RepID=UPI0011500C80|nr:glycosyltransferase family 4 protein [Gramella sp. Hel_I_59]TQI71519.1 glycosyltransferase involved in cell wall biosynthesis [Gramella sp. Hel_I_59]